MGAANRTASSRSMTPAQKCGAVMWTSWVILQSRLHRRALAVFALVNESLSLSTRSAFKIESFSLPGGPAPLAKIRAFTPTFRRHGHGVVAETAVQKFRSYFL